MQIVCGQSGPPHTKTAKELFQANLLVELVFALFYITKAGEIITLIAVTLPKVRPHAFHVPDPNINILKEKRYRHKEPH